jgi:hypothetical protein
LLDYSSLFISRQVISDKLNFVIFEDINKREGCLRITLCAIVQGAPLGLPLGFAVMEGADNPIENKSRSVVRVPCIQGQHAMLIDHGHGPTTYSWVHCPCQLPQVYNFREKNKTQLYFILFIFLHLFKVHATISLFGRCIGKHFQLYTEVLRPLTKTS